MVSVFEKWQQNDPVWLLDLSRSVLYSSPNREQRDPQFKSGYLNQFKLKTIPNFESAEVLDNTHSSLKPFFLLLKEEAETYYNSFQGEFRDNIYAQEIISQIRDIYGDEVVSKYIHNENSMWDSIGNMALTIVNHAIADSMLIEYLYKQGDLTSEERDVANSNVNNRLSRIGINGIDKLFETHPELEKFIENDTRVINTSHIRDSQFKEMTRAACYLAAKARIQDDAANWSSSITHLPYNPATLLKQQIINSDFPKLEKKKESYLMGQQTIQEATRDHQDSSNVFDSIAMGNSKFQTFVDSLHKNRAETDNSKKLEDGSGDYEFNSSSNSSNVESKSDGAPIGAKIATLGGATAVGLLLASGKNKEDKDKSYSAIRFATLATATVVSLGGIILWSKRPESLYKTLMNLINSVGLGRT